jgi:tetratricopeptide (TPR) repeat protein
VQDYTLGGKSRIPLEIFYSYTQKDEHLQNELENHLSILKHQGRITNWHYRKIMPGVTWRDEIDHHLNRAQIILFLISPDFLASDYCYNIEVRSSLERHNAGKAHVIPVLLRPADWEGSSFGNLQPLPENGKPITLWRSRDKGFLEVALGIKAVIVALEEQNDGIWARSYDPSTTAAIIHADMWDNNRYEEALNIYEQATILKPDNAFAYRIKGEILYELNLYKAALAAYDKAISLNPSDALTYINKGDVLAKLNHTQNALLAYGQAILLNPEEAISYSKRGDVLCKLNRDGEAFAAYERAICLNPMEAVAYKGIGEILYKQKQYEQSLIAYEKAIEIDSYDATALMRKGDILCKLGHLDEADFAYRRSGEQFYEQDHYEEALDVYDKALNRHPDDPLLHRGRGNTLRQMERFDEAEISYKRSGDLFYEQGHYEEANADYMLGLTLSPSNALILARIGGTLYQLGSAKEAEFFYKCSGDLFYKQGQLQRAIDVYDEAINLGSNDYLIYISKGDALMYLRRNQEALIAYEKAIQIMVGGVHISLKAYDGALAVCEKAIQLDPHNFIAYVRREQTWSRLGFIDKRTFPYTSSGNDIYVQSQYQRTLAVYDKAINQASNDYLIQLCEGQDLEERGCDQEALIAYEKAIQLDPTNIVAYLKKGHLHVSLKAYDGALAVYDRTLAFDKNVLHALFSCGLVYYKLQLLTSHPTRGFAIRSDYLLALHPRHIRAEEYRSKITSLLREKKIFDLRCEFCNRLIVLGAKFCPNCGQAGLLPVNVVSQHDNAKSEASE